MSLRHELKEVFGHVYADTGLKERTKTFLAEATNGYTGRWSRAKHRWHKAATACTVGAAALCAVLGICLTPTAAIGIEIDSEIELGVNRFDRVVSVRSVSSDGVDLGQSLQVQFESYDAALQEIVESDAVQLLLEEGEPMAITVTGADAGQTEALLAGAEQCTARQENTYCNIISEEEAASAQQAGVAPGKYRAFLELMELDPNVQAETVQGMSMREIREAIASLTEANEENLPVNGTHESETNYGNTAGFGRGNGSSGGGRDAQGQYAGNGAGNGNGGANGNSTGARNGNGGANGNGTGAGNGNGGANGSGTGARNGNGGANGSGSQNGFGGGNGNGGGAGSSTGAGRGRGRG